LVILHIQQRIYTKKNKMIQLYMQKMIWTPSESAGANSETPNHAFAQDDDQPEMVEDSNVDPFQFMLPRVYCFKQELGEYLIQCLRPREVDVTSPDAIMGLNGAFFPLQEEVALGDFHKRVVKKYERFKKSFGIIRMEDEDRLFNRKHPTLIVPYIDEWASIVQRAHCGDETHVPELKTLLNIGNHNWLIRGNSRGIPKPNITGVIKTCRECNFGQPKNVRGGIEQCQVQ
jgi:hypothetical protein